MKFRAPHISGCRILQEALGGHAGLPRPLRPGARRVRNRKGACTFSDALGYTDRIYV